MSQIGEADQAPDAARHLIDTIESGGNFRFAVRGPRGHSGTWTAFGRGNEYYIGARSVMGSMKLSLHGSGVCRLALTEQQYRALAAEGLSQPSDRAFLKWRRADTPERGAVHVVSLIFPSDHLVLPEPSGAYRKPLAMFGEAPLGKAVEFAFFFSREGVVALEERFIRGGGKPLIGTTLEDGTVVSIVVREIDFDRSVLPAQDKLDGAACTPLSREIYEIAGERSDFTGVFWTKPADGQALFMYEIGGVGLRLNS